jgi:hypothetical protein
VDKVGTTETQAGQSCLINEAIWVSLYQRQHCIVLQILMGILLPVSATALKMAWSCKNVCSSNTSAVYLRTFFSSINI